MNGAGDVSAACSRLTHDKYRESILYCPGDLRPGMANGFPYSDESFRDDLSLQLLFE
jgi:hypothetical protein